MTIEAVEQGSKIPKHCNVELIISIVVNVWVLVSWKLYMRSQHETNVSHQTGDVSKQLTKWGSEIGGSLQPISQEAGTNVLIKLSVT